MTPETLADAQAHALECYPEESCGLVVVVRGRERYWPCRNIAGKPCDDFVMDYRDRAAADDAGEIVGVVHSHPGETAKPTEGDLVECEKSELAWTIISVMRGDGSAPYVAGTFEFQPTGYQAPLVGRSYHHGVLDCWSLCRDWYAREWGLTLPDPERPDNWWDDGHSDLYRENLKAAGFYEIQLADVRKGDMIVMEIESKNRVPNHAAIYIGDGLMLHHRPRRLSSRDVYGGYWRERTRMVVRHKAAPV